MLSGKDDRFALISYSLHYSYDILLSMDALPHPCYDDIESVLFLTMILNLSDKNGFVFR